MDEYIKVLKEMSEHSAIGLSLLQILDEELSLPNIPLPTMGGHIWWNDIISVNGWRMQQNYVTRHARILDKNDVRIAWGTVNGMYKTLDRLVNALHRYQEDSEEVYSKRIYAMEELKKLKELLDLGIITENEYQEKKKKIIKDI